MDASPHQPRAEVALDAQPLGQAGPRPAAKVLDAQPPRRRPQDRSLPHDRGSRPAQAGRPQGRRRRPLSRFLEGEDNPSFYLSLSDLMCLLVVFFVLIFSLSDTGGPTRASSGAAAPAPAAPVKKAAKAFPAPRVMADPFPNPEPVPAGVRVSMVSVAAAGQVDPALVPEAAPPQRDDYPARPAVFDRALFTLVAASAPLPPSALPEAESSLGELLGHVQGQTQGLEVDARADRVVLRLPEAITFDLAKAEIKPVMRESLARLAAILTRHPEVPVTITGHTDDLPIHTPQFASNWELSAARAAAVGRALMGQGLDQSRLTIRGLADRQPRLPNHDEASRSQNRRVEIELRLQG